MSLRLVAAAKTDVGKQREQNEDACFAQVVEGDGQNGGIFIVADGMGGYHAGEVASQIAVETIGAGLKALLAPPSAQPTVRLNKNKRGASRAAKDRSRETAVEAESESGSEELPTPTTGEEEASEEGAREGAVTQSLSESLVLEHYAEKLRAAVEHSSEAIVEYGRQHSEARGLGSTVTCALIIGDQAFIANVGDSRTYLLHNGKLDRITQDHSLVERLVQAGQIDADDVYDHPNRNLIYRSLGADRAEVDVDIFTETLVPGDVLLLCSDGLWEMVRNSQIESILNEVNEPGEAGTLLVDRANDNGGEDNITAVVVRCVEA